MSLPNIPDQSQHELVKMWLAPASNMARHGDSPERITNFLRRKGVDPKVAAELAEQLCARTRRSGNWGKILWRVTGWALVIGGLGLFVLGLIAGEVIIIPGGLTLLGAAMLWAPELLSGNS